MPRQTATNSRRGRDQPIIVHLGIMGNGVEKQCIKKGSTVNELFEQAGANIDSSATVRLNNRTVQPTAKIDSDNSVVTVTSAVRGG